MNEITQDWYTELRRYWPARQALQLARRAAAIGLPVGELKRGLCPEALEHVLRNAQPGTDEE